MSTTPMSYTNAEPLSATPYLKPSVLGLAEPLAPGTRVLDVGCGNGYWAALFANRGCVAVGIEPSETGIAVARKSHPGVRFEEMGASANMLAELGEQPFELVVSTEVVEHLYDPPEWAFGCFNALSPGGKLILSTPYHGWLKDVVVAVAGKSDFHHDSLRVGGHIKFFSNATLRQLLAQAGFSDLKFVGAGRVPYMWKSIVVCATRPR